MIFLWEIVRAQPLCLFSWKAIWRTKAPQKKILCENLIKVGFSMVSRCCMCCCSGETMNHLLICCSIDFELWSCIFRMFGVQWVLPKKGFRFIVLVAMSWIKFEYLESYSSMFDVDYVEGTKLAYFWKCGLHVFSNKSILH